MSCSFLNTFFLETAGVLRGRSLTEMPEQVNEAECLKSPVTEKQVDAS